MDTKDDETLEMRYGEERRSGIDRRKGGRRRQRMEWEWPERRQSERRMVRRRSADRGE